MDIQEHIPLRPKTTMRIGGSARYFAELASTQDAEDAVRFAKEHDVPLVVLGGGANTIFADGIINALVVRITANAVNVERANVPTCKRVTVESGKNLPMLVSELAEQGLDLSPLAGIPGSAGGAIFGNAGQGPKGIWIDSFIESVTAYVNGDWREFSHDECQFDYRNSFFKERITNSSQLKANSSKPTAPVIWSTTFSVPARPAAEIKAEIERLLRRRLETQPHHKTAGSCFKAIGDTPAWQLIEAAGLRGMKTGDVRVSEQHANFLLNEGEASFDDAIETVRKIRKVVGKPLEVEMRFIQQDGTLLF